ncbi:MAG: hypothetical protein ABI656_04105, partial [bacterium]
LLPLPLTARSPDADDAAETAAPEVPEVIILAEAPPPAISDSQWEALEQQISERVLSQLQTRIDFVLEQQVGECLASTLQLAVDSVLAEIRRSLNHTLKEDISSAVTQEIAQLKTDQKPAKHILEN